MIFTHDFIRNLKVDECMGEGFFILNTEDQNYYVHFSCITSEFYQLVDFVNAVIEQTKLEVETSLKKEKNATPEGYYLIDCGKLRSSDYVYINDKWVHPSKAIYKQFGSSVDAYQKVARKNVSV